MTQTQKIPDRASLLGDLPPRPKTLIAINKEAEKPNASFAVIAKLIAEDVSISASVLKIANSAAFRRPSPMGSIDQALNMLGFKRVLAIVNSVSIRAAIASKHNLDEFWEFGTIVATAGVMVAQYCKKSNLADDAYTTGLFHDACSPFLMNLHPEYYDFFLAGNAEGWILSIAEEEEKYGTTHNILSALMAQVWTLPDQIVMAIYHLHNTNVILPTSDAGDPTMFLLSIVKCAREIARFYQFDKADNPEWLHCKELVLEYLSLDEDDFIEMRNSIAEKLEA